MMRKLLMVGGFAVAMALMAGTAKADPITFTQGSFTATVTVSGNTATLTFGSGLNAYSTDEVAIHVENGATVLNTSTASPGTWTLQNGLNSVNCGGTGNWFCAVSGSNVSFNGLSFTWNFSGGTPADLISVQFAVCNSLSPNCAPGSSNFVTNFSQSGPTTVPEPGTLSLLGVGLLPLLGFGRRFFA